MLIRNTIKIRRNSSLLKQYFNILIYVVNAQICKNIKNIYKKIYKKYMKIYVKFFMFSSKCEISYHAELF